MADNSIYQEVANEYAPQAGPFSEVLMKGLHPALQQQPTQQLTGYEGKAGIMAMLGDKALQGVQKGRMMAYLAGEAKKDQAYKGSLAEIDQQIRNVQENNNLTPEQKQKYVDELSHMRIQYTTAHYNNTMGQLGIDTGAPQQQGQGQQGQQKPKKEKKTGLKGKVQGAENVASQAAGFLGHILNRVAGPNLPQTEAANTDWVKSRLFDMQKTYSFEAGQKAKQDVINDIMAKVNATTDSEQVNSILAQEQQRLGTVFNDQERAQFEASVRGSRPTPEIYEARQVRRATDKIIGGHIGDGLEKEREGPPGAPTPRLQGGLMDVNAGYLGSQGAKDAALANAGFKQVVKTAPDLTPEQAKSPLAPFMVGVPKGFDGPYSDRAIADIHRQFGISQPTWYLVDKKGEYKELTQFTPVMGGVGARYLDSKTGQEIDTQAAENAGWHLQSDRPYRDPNQRYELRVMSREDRGNKPYLAAVDATTGEIHNWVGPTPDQQQRPEVMAVFKQIDTNRIAMQNKDEGLDKELSTYLAALQKTTDPLLDQTQRDAANKLLGLDPQQRMEYDAAVKSGNKERIAQLANSYADAKKKDIIQRKQANDDFYNDMLYGIKDKNGQRSGGLMEVARGMGLMGALGTVFANVPGGPGAGGPTPPPNTEPSPENIQKTFTGTK